MTPAENPHIVDINVESVLFDMDGTLINSSPAVVKAWTLFSETYPLDLDDILKCRFFPAGMRGFKSNGTSRSRYANH
jgi:phosphoglycolate phosphatase-like HAD superfamily hydrolase